MSDASLRDSQNGDRSWVDLSGKFLTLEIYEGIITVIPIAPEPLKRAPVPATSASNTSEEQAFLGEPHQARIEELSVRSTAFLHQDPARPPRLAILYENTQGRVRLKLRDLAYSRGIIGGEASVAEFTNVDDLYDDLELGADLLIPVPLPLGEYSKEFNSSSCSLLNKRFESCILTESARRTDYSWREIYQVRRC